MGLSIGFRCDGNSSIGMGHVSRCLGLAEVLRDRFDDHIHFFMFDSPQSSEHIRSRGFQVTELVGGQFEQLNTSLGDFRPHVWVVDEREYLSSNDLLALSSNGSKIVLIDDLSDKRVNADFVFYPPIPQLKSLNWNQFSGEMYSGWEWVLLKSEFSGDVPENSNPKSDYGLRVLLTFGGADPWGFARKVLDWVDSLNIEFQIELVTNSGFHHFEELSSFLSDHHFRHPIEITENPTNMRSLMLGADLAISTFGVTAYELAATGTPSVLLCPTEDHYQSACIFQENELAFVVDASDQAFKNLDLIKQDILTKLSRLLTDPEILEQMGNHAKNLRIGNGAQLIAKKLHDVIGYSEF